ncbi:MAG: fibronectin type III domain-containing protein [Acidimicrobiales bacterium]
MTGLKNGITFSVKVRAAASKKSAYSAPVTVIPGVPAAPTGVSAVPGKHRATVSFTAPSDNGSTITSFRVTASDSSDPARGGETDTGSASPINVTGLSNSDSYTFTVSATNGNGTGAASAPSAAVTPG